MTASSRTVGHIDRSDSVVFRGEENTQPDRSRTEDSDFHAFERNGAADRVNADRKRFGKRRFLE